MPSMTEQNRTWPGPAAGVMRPAATPQPRGTNTAFQSEEGLLSPACVTHDSSSRVHFAPPREPLAQDRSSIPNSIVPLEDMYLSSLNKEVQTTAEHIVTVERPPDADKDADSDEDEVVNKDPNCCVRKIAIVHEGFRQFWTNHKHSVHIATSIFLLLLYTAYVIYAIVHSPLGSVGLILLTTFVLLWVLVPILWSRKGNQIKKHCCLPAEEVFKKVWTYLKWVLIVLVVVAICVFIGLDVARDIQRLTSLGGLLIIVLLSFITSNNPSRVKWRPVLTGMLLQLVMGLVVLRWRPGFYGVQWVANQTETFLSFSKAGSEFVFDNYQEHRFAFESLPVVIYFSAVISVLYHLGIMQRIINIFAVTMQVAMGTTAIESLACASNIFVSYVEVAPILIPYFDRLTRSEIHAILCSGFASVAGSIMVIYIGFGAPAEHLISACLMSAPAALAVAKLTYPETKKSRTKTLEDVEINMTKKERNVMEAAANGAMAAIKLVAGICACLIAFLGIVGFVNAILAYLGSRVGYPDLSFQTICSYLFWPLTVAMGVDVDDADKVASMLGVKIFVDDVLCYRDLGVAVKAGTITKRSQVIATYACCGFGSLGALGVALGAMLSISTPRKRYVVTQLMWRALVNGNVAAFMTACIAGILYQEDHGLWVSNTINSHNITTTPHP